MQRFLIATLVAASLVGCSTTDPDVIRREDTQRMSTVQEAIIVSVRNVTVEGEQSGAGGVAGGVVGGIAGSSVGGSREGAIVGVLAAVAGAVIGNAVERGATREDALELMVQLRSGERRVIVQAKGKDTFQAGDKVFITTTGGRVRVTRIPGMGNAPAEVGGRDGTQIQSGDGPVQSYTN